MIFSECDQFQNRWVHSLTDCFRLFRSSQRRSSVIEITGNNSEWSESEDQEDDTQEEGDMELDGDISSSNDSSSFSTGDW